uniref:Uncharacterized protein n=1 Tax=Dicentrarchus labrax TaxID=13489 RepID=A0A8C4GQN6_DICLA
MNPVNVTSLSVHCATLWRDPRDPWRLCKLLPLFHQCLSCLVLCNLLSVRYCKYIFTPGGESSSSKFIFRSCFSACCSAYLEANCNSASKKGPS